MQPESRAEPWPCDAVADAGDLHLEDGLAEDDVDRWDVRQCTMRS